MNDGKNLRGGRNLPSCGSARDFQTVVEPWGFMNIDLC